MNKIQKYAYFLRLLLLFIGIPSIIGTFIYKWFWTGTHVFNSLRANAMRSANLAAPGVNIVPTTSLKLLATAIDAVSITVMLWGCIYFIKLLSLYCKGELFSKNILRFYRKIIWIAFFWSIYNPIKFMLIGIVTTISNPKGQRVLYVAFQGRDIFHIFIVGTFLVINSLMHEAYKLKEEHDLTV